MSEKTKHITSVALFQEKTVRRVWYQDRWYFSIIDVIAILTDSPNSRRYWSDLKRDLAAEGFDEVYAQSVQLKMEAACSSRSRLCASSSARRIRCDHPVCAATTHSFHSLL